MHTPEAEADAAVVVRVAEVLYVLIVLDHLVTGRVRVRVRLRLRLRF